FSSDGASGDIGKVIANPPFLSEVTVCSASNGTVPSSGKKCGASGASPLPATGVTESRIIFASRDTVTVHVGSERGKLSRVARTFALQSGSAIGDSLPIGRVRLTSALPG